MNAISSNFAFFQKKSTRPNFAKTLPNAAPATLNRNSSTQSKNRLMARKKKATTDPASTSGVKRVKYVAAGDADDDVFEQVPNLSRSKRAEAAPAYECEEGVVIADQRRICPQVV